MPAATRVEMLRVYLLEQKKVADPEDVVTCELHGERRRSEKFLRKLFCCGVLLPLAGRTKEFVKSVEEEVNNNILGRKHNMKEK